MFFLIGMVIVFGCVLGSYGVHGNFKVLWQPLEFVIIFGAGIGAFLIGNPPSIVKDSLKAYGTLFKVKPYSKKDYMELLMFMMDLFKFMKTKGNLAVEPHVENPAESDIFKKYPSILKNHHIVDFICDTIRLITIGVDNQYVMSDALEREIDIHHHETETVASAMVNFGDSLPALGIVAAVLGVIITMGSISEPPEVLGGLIGAALVGTFAGILLSYGVFSPVGGFVGKFAHAQTEYLNCIKVGIISHMQGNAPAVTVELVRKTIPGHERPSFKEVDAAANK